MDRCRGRRRAVLRHQIDTATLLSPGHVTRGNPKLPLGLGQTSPDFDIVALLRAENWTGPIVTGIIQADCCDRDGEPLSRWRGSALYRQAGGHAPKFRGKADV